MNLKRTIGIAIALAATLSVNSVHAGILRNVLSSVGLSKPDEAKPAADGVQSFPRLGYTCCDLHYSKDWINDYNFAELPIIPAGTPVEVTNYGRYRAFLKIEGKPMRLGQDYGRDQETLDKYVKKIIVSDDPRPRIASYPAGVQEAIRQGKVSVGMTREQVIVSLGHPMPSENVSLDAPAWRYWRASGAQYNVYFGPDGHVMKVTGDDAVVDQVLLK